MSPFPLDGRPQAKGGEVDRESSGRGTILVAFLGFGRARCHSRTCLCMEYLSLDGVSCLLVVPLFPGRAPLEMMEASISPLSHTLIRTPQRQCNNAMGKLRVQVVVRSLGPLDTRSTLWMMASQSEGMDDDDGGWCSGDHECLPPSGFPTPSLLPLPCPRTGADQGQA